MLINSNHRLGKQHFTVAHELYHLFVQGDFKHEISNSGKFDKSDKEEYRADWFAAYLLMPDAGIESLIPKQELSKDKVSLATIVKIEQYFACSRSALLYRLEDMGLISKKTQEIYKSNVIKSAQELGYSTDLYFPANDGLILGNYGVLAKELLDNEKISESHYLSLMLDLGIDINLGEGDNEQE
jgi:Zn-dependent peptidase ImmA (M78 family)